MAQAGEDSDSADQQAMDEFKTQMESGLDMSKEAFLKYSYVIMFDGESRPTDRKGNQYREESKQIEKFYEIVATRAEVVKQLKHPRTGLQVTRRKSSDKKANATYVLISADESRLLAEAENRKLVMQLKPSWGGGFEEFKLENKHMFKPAKTQFFRHATIMFLIDSIIQGDIDQGGAGLNIAQLMRHGVVSKYFGLHNTRKRKELIQVWGKAFFKYQPLDSIRNYFGEEIALYFAWLGYYTQWLWIATVPGLVAFIFYVWDKFGTKDGWSIWPITAYSIFLAIWATFFMEYWKRYQYSLSWKWGMLDFEETEEARPDFKGDECYGVYQNGEWVTLDPVEDKRLLQLDENDEVPKTKYSRKKLMFLKMASWSPITLVAITAVLVGTAAILAFRLFMQVVAGQTFLGAILGGSMNAIFIILTNGIWRGVAVKLTNIENHRTQTQWDDSFLIKTFLFQFINSYSSFYYLAFFKRGFVFFDDASLTDSCRTGQSTYNVISFGCLDELTLQVASILGTNMVFGQIREVLAPWAITKIQIYLLKRKTEQQEQEEMEQMKFPQWERESKLAMFEGTFDEYNEMVIQFGYLTMFAAALPIASLFAVLNNVVEIRTDAIKLLTSHPRPHYKGASDIGGWEGILEALGVLAVVTNTMLIGLSFESMRDVAFGDDESQLDEPDVRRQDFAIFAAIVILEHFLLALKYFIAYLVPDSPGWVRKELARQDFVREHLLKKLEAKILRKEWGVSNSDEESDPKTLERVRVDAAAAADDDDDFN